MGKGRQTILRLLSEGKITIEEAEELLDAIPNNTGLHIGQDIFGKKPSKFKNEQRNEGKSSGFNLDFHFPWDDPGWKWPWDQEGWQWPWDAQHQSNDEERSEWTYNVQEDTSLIIKCHDGNLTIQGWDNEETVKINSFGEEVSSEIGDDNKTVYVTSEDADVSIMIPLRVSSIQISSGDGNINISNIRTDISLQMDDGNAMMSGMEGKIFASLHDGNIVLNDIHSKEVAVKAEDGSISLNMAPPVNEGSFNLKVDDGRLMLTLPSDCACQITANVGDGAIRHELTEAEILDENEGFLSAKLNDGGAEFILSAEDGEIIIREGN